jgi:hypothetical protein
MLGTSTAKGSRQVSHLILAPHKEAGTVIIFTAQMRKLKLREVKFLA